jgi:hypothetical protein
MTCIHICGHSKRGRGHRRWKNRNIEGLELVVLSPDSSDMTSLVHNDEPSSDSSPQETPIFWGYIVKWFDAKGKSKLGYDAHPVPALTC